MVVFYKILTQVYFFAIKAVSPFNRKAKQIVLGQKNWRNILSQKIDTTQKYIWIHCASLGEFEQGRPLIEKIKEEKKEYKIILTFFSPSGYEIRKNYEYADIVCYLPFDSKKNANDFIEIVNPVYAVFVKYEFWYFMIERLSQFKIPFFLISGIFRENQIFFKSYGRFYLDAIRNFSFMFLQDKDSEKLLNKFGIENTLVCGDTRFDRVVQISKQEYTNPVFETFVSSSDVVVCGSTWPDDEKIISEYINNSGSSVKFIIVPHEISDKHIDNLESGIKKIVLKYSEITDQNLSSANVIIVNTIGLLSKLYRYGKIAYIGGGFGKGIHNTLEASVYRIPVVFGHNFEKFKEAKDLLSIGSAFSINNYSDFKEVVDSLLVNQTRLEEIENKTNEYFKNSYGATMRIFDKIEKINQK